jgi:hypothetical protein
MIDDDGTFCLASLSDLEAGQPTTIHYLYVRNRIEREVTVFVVGQISREEFYEYGERHNLGHHPLALTLESKFYRVRMD